MLADDLAPEVFHIAAREASESDERGGAKVATVHPLPNDGPNQTGTQSGWCHCADQCGGWGARVSTDTEGSSPRCAMFRLMLYGPDQALQQPGSSVIPEQFGVAS